MNCHEVVDLLCRHEADLLEEGLPAAVKTHLEGCDSCCERAKGLQTAVSEFRELPVIEPDADFLSRSWSAIERAPARPAWEAKAAEPWWSRVLAGMRGFAFVPVAAAGMAAILFVVLRPVPAPRVEVEEVVAAKVLEKRGPVEVRVEGDSTVVAVGEGGFARVEHRAGAVVEIAPASEVEFELAGVTTVSSGSARYRVEKRAKGETYITRTWQYDVTVLGTTYDVTVSKEECQVALVEGRIGLALPGLPTMTAFLDPGESHAGAIPERREPGIIANTGEGPVGTATGIDPASAGAAPASVAAGRPQTPTESPAAVGTDGQPTEVGTGQDLNNVFK